MMALDSSTCSGMGGVAQSGSNVHCVSDHREVHPIFGSHRAEDDLPAVYADPHTDGWHAPGSAQFRQHPLHVKRAIDGAANGSVKTVRLVRENGYELVSDVFVNNATIRHNNFDLHTQVGVEQYDHLFRRNRLRKRGKPFDIAEKRHDLSTRSAQIDAHSQLRAPRRCL